MNTIHEFDGTDAPAKYPYGQPTRGLRMPPSGLAIIEHMQGWSQVLPSQVPDRSPAVQPHEYEIRRSVLALAIFDVYIAAIQQNPHPKSAHVRRGREAWDWLLNDDTVWPFAAANICDLLGLDLLAVRKGVSKKVAELKAAGATKLPDGLRLHYKPNAGRLSTINEH